MSLQVEPSYYNILGVKMDVPASRLTIAYYRALEEKNPDKHPDNPNAEMEYQLVKAAYKTLSDPDARRHYEYMVEIAHINRYIHYDKLQIEELSQKQRIIMGESTAAQSGLDNLLATLSRQNLLLQTMRADLAHINGHKYGMRRFARLFHGKEKHAAARDRLEGLIGDLTDAMHANCNSVHAARCQINCSINPRLTQVTKTIETLQANIKVWEDVKLFAMAEDKATSSGSRST